MILSILVLFKKYKKKGGEKMTLKELKAKYNVPECTVRKWIHKGLLPAEYKGIGHPYEVIEENFLYVKKYYWNDRTRITYNIGWNRDIFKNIDSPEKAYWLGFILADGCLHISNANFSGHISIDISGRDVEHLKKFVTFIEAIEPEKMIQYTKHSVTGNDLVHVQLVCSATSKDLFNLGIKPNKSGKEKWIDTPFP